MVYVTVKEGEGKSCVSENESEREVKRKLNSTESDHSFFPLDFSLVPSTSPIIFTGRPFVAELSL